MGGLLYDRSITFAEDLLLEEFHPHMIINGENKTIDSLDSWYINIAVDRYNKAAMNCWIAGGIYVVTLIVSVYSAMMNKKYERF